jgi:hypothetical protein
MNQSDLSEDVQRALLAQWKATKASQKKKPSLKASNVWVPVHVQTEGVVPLTGESSGKKKKERARGENPTEKLIRETLRARNSEPRASVVRVIEPAQQINPVSYLGKVLEQAGKKVKPEKRKQPAPSGGGDPGCSDPSDDESTSTSDMSTSDSSESSTDESGNDSSGRRHHRRRSARKSEDYDGTPNAQAFSQFVIGGSAYLEAGKVGKRNQVFILSRYLTMDNGRLLP